ncbi:MAG: phosphonopyruvate decarboxylase [Rhodospirillaceae bacterium]
MTQTHDMTADAASPWGRIIFDALTAADVRQVTYVPDAGHARLITLCREAPGMTATVLTTEEEGVAIAAGAWLGGQRAALLMQSSGVGNCVNMFSLIASCRLPFLSVVTMRGEWDEFNPWQEPMGRATPQAFEIMGVRVMRVEKIEDLAGVMSAATAAAFQEEQAVAVILAQRLLGRKKWVEK